MATTFTSAILAVDNEKLEQSLALLGVTVTEIRPAHVLPGPTIVQTEVDIAETVPLPPAGDPLFVGRKVGMDLS